MIELHIHIPESVREQADRILNQEYYTDDTLYITLCLTGSVDVELGVGYDIGRERAYASVEVKDTASWILLHTLWEGSSIPWEDHDKMAYEFDVGGEKYKLCFSVDADIEEPIVLNSSGNQVRYIPVTVDMLFD